MLKGNDQWKKQRRFSQAKDSLGFTLTESLIGLLLFTILVGACLMVFVSGTDSWQANAVHLELQQELRKSMNWIKDDLRQSGTSAISNVSADGTLYNTITFNIASGVNTGTIVWSANSIQYVLGGPGSDQLQRIVGLQTKIVAQNVNVLHFQRQGSTPNIVNVSLQAQKNTLRGRLISVNLNFKAKLRN